MAEAVLAVASMVLLVAAQLGHIELELAEVAAVIMAPAQAQHITSIQLAAVAAV
jgi:hypothetical protein